MDEPLTAAEKADKLSADLHDADTEHDRLWEDNYRLRADLARLHAVIREAVEDLDHDWCQEHGTDGACRFLEIADDLRSAVESRALPEGGK